MWAGEIKGIMGDRRSNSINDVLIEHIQVNSKYALDVVRMFFYGVITWQTLQFIKV